MEILIFKTHFFKFEISKGAVIRSGMVQSDMWNKHKALEDTAFSPTDLPTAWEKQV